MLKANKRTLIITSIVTVLPILIGVFFWNRLPDELATHFGPGNEADGFSSKAFAVIGLPLLLLAIEWVCAIVTAQDPKRQNISPKLFPIILWLVPIISLTGAAMMYSYNLGYQTDASFIAHLLVGVVLIVAGNYLPKSRQNYTVGIKIPWTLANEENWNRTHRLAGFLWVIAGFLLVVAALTGFSEAEWMLAVVLALALVIPCVYSFLLHTKKGL